MGFGSKQPSTALSVISRARRPRASLKGRQSMPGGENVPAGIWSMLSMITSLGTRLVEGREKGSLHHFAHTLLTPFESVGVAARIRPARFCLECATYDCIGLARTARSGFDSR